jgi:hypothetical protein
MAKFKLAFGLHNHQPVGNFEAVFEEAHHKAYLPFLNLMADYPLSQHPLLSAPIGDTVALAETGPCQLFPTGRRYGR